MSTYSARCVEVGPTRVMVAWLPWPEGWTKHDRISVMKTGRRFMIPAAREYRARVAAILAPALPDSPWYDASREWRYSMRFNALGQGTDHDQHMGGILDDLCKSGLCANDDHARWLLPEYEPSAEPVGVWVLTRQFYSDQHA